MKLIEQMKNEDLGCVLLYNFTLGYNRPVPVSIYDYVLPLLFSQSFTSHILNASSYKECVEETRKEDPALFDDVRNQLEELKQLTNRTLGLAVVNRILAFETVEQQVCGVTKTCSILPFNEAIRLGEWFNQLTLEEMMAPFSIQTKKIVILDGETLGDDIDLTLFKKLGSLTIYPASTQEEAVERIADAHYVLVNKVVLDEKVLKSAEHLEYIGLFATGTNNIDLAYCQNHQITVKNVSGYSTDIVAQHTFALLLYLYEKMAYYDHYVLSGDYCRSPSFSHFGMPFNELAGKTWGIIGLGQIGCQVAKIAEAFGCHVIYYSTSGRNHHDHYQQVPFFTLLEQSDIVSIHAPLNEQTYHLFNGKAFAHMKRTAYLINVGRGPIIDEFELAFALKHHLIAGAGLDVLETEPMTKDSPLLPLCDSQHLVITPHSAWAAVETRNRLVQFAFSNLKAFIEENVE